MKKLSFSIAILLGIAPIFSQEAIDQFDAEQVNWQNRDIQLNNTMGVSVEKAYDSLLKDIDSRTEIIVAVIDGGVDTEHEDLQGKIWVNEDEIPNNGLDDDNNGYIDDIHGWNFLGNADGEHVHYENMEYTRIVKENDPNNPDLETARAIYESEMRDEKRMKNNITSFEKKYRQYKSIIRSYTGIDVHNAGDLDSVVSTNIQVTNAKQYLANRYAIGFTEEGLKRLKYNNNEALDYLLNVNLNGRDLVGDDLNEFNDRSYGNPDVK